MSPSESNGSSGFPLLLLLSAFYLSSFQIRACLRERAVRQAAFSLLHGQAYPGTYSSGVFAPCGLTWQMKNRARRGDSRCPQPMKRQSGRIAGFQHGSTSGRKAFLRSVCGFTLTQWQSQPLICRLFRPPERHFPWSKKPAKAGNHTLSCARIASNVSGEMSCSILQASCRAVCSFTPSCMRYCVSTL